jgi:hypothetical protein
MDGGKGLARLATCFSVVDQREVDSVSVSEIGVLEDRLVPGKTYLDAPSVRVTYRDSVDPGCIGVLCPTRL